MPHPEVAALADDYWDAVLAANPSTGTLLGDHRFDDQLEDVSSEGERARRAQWSQLRERLEAIDTGGLDATDEATCLQLSQELGDAVDGIDQRLSELRSDQMTGIHVELLTLAPLLAAPDPESAWKLVQRLRQVPTAFARAAQRFVDGVAAGRAPARVCIDRSLNTIDGYLASPLGTDAFVGMRGPDADGRGPWTDETKWRAALADAVAEQVRPAYALLAEVMRRQLLPVARDDARCGLAALDDGAALYATWIRHHTSAAPSPAELHRFGLAEVTEKLPAEYAAAGGRLFGVGDPASIFERLRQDPALRYQSPGEILDAARANVAAAEAVMGGWFGRLPEAPCAVEPVPDVLADDSPVGYYAPPAPDGSRPGTYFVNTGRPENKARYEAASIGFHEAIPGHHLQITIASELSDLPRFRRFSLDNAAFCEGWGLYAERLADDMDLYPGDLERLGMLSADSLRSCRLVVDTGLHALGWSRAQAMEFLVANTPMSPTEVAIEVDRYIGMPGQALSYKVGQREIFRLRDVARSRLGAGFDIKGFHDAVLGSGSIGLPVLRRAVETWISDSGKI
ncbi:MAG TPA: DUF885 domain-containing protein [Acidimicrobiales bacterium]|jgi:uncharacterized protein (DUF885 family)|nr:DUF885 domain-containing protein [Acidimicrobiales bacterium]